MRRRWAASGSLLYILAARYGDLTSSRFRCPLGLPGRSILRGSLRDVDHYCGGLLQVQNANSCRPPYIRYHPRIGELALDRRYRLVNICCSSLLAPLIPTTALRVDLSSLGILAANLPLQSSLASSSNGRSNGSIYQYPS